jgi:hypothetical protein
MKELDSRAETFVKEAASAEAEIVLSRAQRDEIRRRFDARRSGGAPRPRGPMRAVASVGAALAFGFPAWAAAAVGLAVGVGTAFVVVTREQSTRPHDAAAIPFAEPPRPVDHDAWTATPYLGPTPAAPAPDSSTVASTVVEPSPPPVPPARHVVPAPAASSGGSQVPAAASAEGPSPESGLGAEAALLESAERSLRDHDDARALALLDEHARRFPDGIFLVEAEAARAIATCETGDGERGSKLAADFARRWPNAPVLARVLAACRIPRTDR